MRVHGSVGLQLVRNGGARSRSPRGYWTSSCSAAGSSSWSFAGQVTDTGCQRLPLPKGKGYFMKDDADNSTQKGDYDGNWEKGEGDYDRATKKDTAGQYDKKL